MYMQLIEEKKNALLHNHTRPCTGHVVQTAYRDGFLLILPDLVVCGCGDDGERSGEGRQAGFRRSTVIVCVASPMSTLKVLWPGSTTLKGPW